MPSAKRISRSLLLAAASLSLLSGCGGGSDDTGFDFLSLSPAQVCVTTSSHTDGDTFRCTTSQASFTVRLSSIDAPETGQTFALESRNRLAQLTPGGTLVDCYKLDAYGRSVCRVYSATGVDVQARLLLDGLAWYNVNSPFRFVEQTDYEQDEYPVYMLTAKAASRGLWAQASPQSPWDCRAVRAIGGTCL